MPSRARAADVTALSQVHGGGGASPAETSAGIITCNSPPAFCQAVNERRLNFPGPAVAFDRGKEPD
jgi:hypothetical protein